MDNDAGVFDPRVAFNTIGDNLLKGVRGNFNHHIDWLEGYFQQVRTSDVLKERSPNIAASTSRATTSLAAAEASTSNAGNNNTTSFELLKSPVRKRIKQTTSHLSPASASTSISGSASKQNALTALQYGVNHNNTALPFNSTKQKNIFGSHVEAAHGPSKSSSTRPYNDAQPTETSVNNHKSPIKSSSNGSLSRSPAKQGLKSLSSTSSLYRQQHQHVDDHLEHNKENSMTITTATSETNGSGKSSNTSRMTNKGLSAINTTRSPASASSAGLGKSTTGSIRSPLQSSTSRARQQQQQQQQQSNLSASAPASPPSRLQASAHAQAAMGGTNARTGAASPSATPRPASRTLPRSPNANASAKTATQQYSPIRVVDDVFTLPSTAAVNTDYEDPRGEEERGAEDSKESSLNEEDDDEEEIENILLGYTKTPATAQGAKKALKSEAAAVAAAASLQHRAQEVQSSEKELPAIPPQAQAQPQIQSRIAQTLSALASQQSQASNSAAATRPSPPRPARSPARAVSSQAQNVPTANGKGIITNISPSKITRPAVPRFGSAHSPVKRDMSHLASIASLLSPSKEEASHQREEHQKYPSGNDGTNAAVIANSRAAASPVQSHAARQASSRVPVPRNEAGSNTNTPTLRPRSPMQSSRPPSRSGSPIPPPKSTMTAAGVGAAAMNSRPASPEMRRNAAGVSGTTSRPVSPSRISSRIAALAGAATRGATSPSSSRNNSPRIGTTTAATASPSQSAAARFGMTRSPRLKNPVASMRDSPAQAHAQAQAHGPSSIPEYSRQSSKPATRAPGTGTASSREMTSGLPTPTKAAAAKRPLLSPIQSPNSQRALALSSLRKAVPGFETNSFSTTTASPPASPRLGSANSMAGLKSFIAPLASATALHEAKDQILKQSESTNVDIASSREYETMSDKELIDQHARAIHVLEKSKPASPVNTFEKTADSADSNKKSIPTGLSPPAKSPLRKLHSQQALAAKAAVDAALEAEAAVIDAVHTRDGQHILPTPSKDGNQTIMPSTTVKKVDVDNTLLQATAHKDSTIDLPPPSPVFSSFLSNNKRPSTLSFAGLPGRAFGGVAGGGAGREKSFGLGLGLGLHKSLGASAAKERFAQQSETSNYDLDSQGSAAASTASAHNRQSFYTAALASQSRKRLSSTLGAAAAHSDLDSQGAKASRTDFSHTARASIAAAQQQNNAASVPMSQSARLDLLRSRISNIKGTTGFMPSSASSRTSFAPSATAAQPVSTNNTANSVQAEKATAPVPHASLFSPPAHQIAPNAALPKEANATSAIPSSASTFAAAIASFVPAPAFGASFASLFGGNPATSRPVTKPDTIAAVSADMAAKSSLYPSLPSMGNLNMLSMPMPSPTSLKHAAVAAYNNDEDEQVEELVSPIPAKQDARKVLGVATESSPSKPQKQRSSSVQSIISNFEAKEAEAQHAKQREASLSPRKASGGHMPLPLLSAPLPARPIPEGFFGSKSTVPTRSTTPPFSPPKQDNLSHRLSGAPDAHMMDAPSRPDSQLSDIVNMDMPASDMLPSEISIAGDVDIEDPGLDAIPRAASEETELPTTDAPSGTENEEDDEEMDNADDEADPDATSTRGKGVADNASRSMAPSASSKHHREQQQRDTDRHFKPSMSASATAGNLSKSTFKPSRPGKEADKVQRPVHRPPSRAPSVSSLAPSRASTISIASTASFNPSRPGTAMSQTSKKANLSVSMSNAAANGSKPGIKSLQNAAAAAQKEQAEKERKAAIKEERDSKRAAFLAAKRDEHQDSQQQSQSSQGKRKDRDDLNASQTTSSQTTASIKTKTTATVTKTKIATNNKVEDEQLKKRKMDTVEVVVHKPSVPKTTVSRPASAKPQVMSQSTTSKTLAGSTTTSNAKALAASASAIGTAKQAPFASSSSSRAPLQASSSKPQPQATKSTNQQALLSQHQQAILSASAAFGKIQTTTTITATTVQASSSKPVEPEEPEVEPFQLPEIDSEYSDSDEDVQAQKAALRPVWTHSPELRQALAVQATFDPDQLFGEMPALKMEEIFKNPATMARLRHRTSSTHWSGPDAISRYEEREYALRMGFKRGEQPPASSSHHAEGSKSNK